MVRSLTQKVINALQADYDTSEVQFLIYPTPPPGVKDEFIVVQHEQRTEVVCFKKTMMKIFIECHKLFYRLDSLDDDEQLFVILGLLLTTTENRTALNMLLAKLNKLRETEINREILFVERLLSCNSARLNKSSSLWDLYKRLYTAYDNNLKFKVWDTVTISCEQHFANYYCCNFVRWFHSQLNDSYRQHFVDDFLRFSKKHVNDPSIWSALGTMIGKTDFDQVIIFIDSLPVTTWSPFLAVLEFGSRNTQIIPSLMKHWTKDDTIFFYHGTPIIPDYIENDLNSKSKFMSNAWKTHLLEKLQKLQLNAR
ncbi:Ecm9 [Kluyveromyces lactis]|nr:Ecm9 [Kluyveromyces lactis]